MAQGGFLTGLPALRPGQISETERKMLYEVASRWRGLGEIVEVGAFLGKSTSCLAAGMLASTHEHKAKRLHVFDRWEVNDSNAFYLRWMKFPSSYRGSFKRLFDRNTEEWSELIETHEGDTHQIPWRGRPIEILFLDCSTSHDFHRMLLRKFYPSLVPQVGIVIHQDYFLHRSYYLPPMMRRLGEYFTMLGNSDTSMFFKLGKPIPDEVMEDVVNMPTEEMLELLNEQIGAFGGIETPHGGVLGTMLVFYHVTHGDTALAMELSEKIRHIRPESETDPVLINLREALKGEEHR